jgi:NADH-quinone oxidoreductase subunit N
MRLLVDGMLPLWHDWQQMLIVLAVLSLALGNLAAIAQTNLKRMFAYSTISHMGFMLLGLLSGVLDGNPLNAADAYSASMFYAIIYVLMSLGGFGMILLLSRAGFEAENLTDFKGLNQRSPWYAFIMLLLMFSMAGVPPTVGFYAKLLVLEPLIVADQTWLAVYAVMFSLIGAYYYLRIVKLMYFDEPEDREPLRAGADMHLLLSANGLLMLVLGILPGLLMDISLFSVETLETLMRLGR